MIQLDGKPIGVHVASWVHANGPLPEGAWISHSCGNSQCVRPDHLCKNPTEGAVSRKHPDYYKLWYTKNKEKVSDYNSTRRLKNRFRMDEIKLSRGCADCGYKKHPAALDFDHISGTKVDNVGTMGGSGRSWSSILEEIDKCAVVCANCHRIRTEERRDCAQASESSL